MPRQKKTSRVLEKIEMRVAGMRAINPKMDFGVDRNLPLMVETIDRLRTKIDAYNTALASINSSQAEIADLERTLSEMAEKMLIGVAFTYGNDSREYEMAGGVKKSDRVRKSVATRLRAKTEPTSGETAQSA
ncbi:MAG: hypothetical protein KME18_13015 [Phormidium tanganyikae FI6-MK23]|jgi:hypothetical protein|nr:hypothetical protein [Phormidium tanganyikae FI6-MK23]